MSLSLRALVLIAASLLFSADALGQVADVFDGPLFFQTEGDIPFKENFDAFLGRAASENPEAGDISARNWTFAPNSFGGVMRHDDAPPSQAQQATTFHALERASGRALGIRAGVTQAVVTLRLNVPAHEHVAGVMNVKFSLSLPEAGKMLPSASPGARIEFSWAWDSGIFKTEPRGSVTLSRDLTEFSPNFPLELPQRQLGSGPPPEDAPLHTIQLRWTVSSQHALVALDDVSVGDAEPNHLVVWVSVDASEGDQNLLRELAREKLSARGFKAISCEADIEYENHIKTLFASLGMTSADQSPNKAQILELVARSGCYRPPHSRLYVAYLAAHTDQRSSRREAVLRLKALDNQEPMSMASVAEPPSEKWAWGTIVDKLAQRILGQGSPAPPTLLSAIYVPTLVSLGFRVNARGSHHRLVQLLRCSDATSCAAAVKKIRAYQKCTNGASWWDERGACETPDIGDPFWVAEQRASDRAAPDPSTSDGDRYFHPDWLDFEVMHPSELVDVEGAQLFFKEPGEYALFESAQGGSSPSARIVHVSAPRNLLRFSAGALLSPSVLAAELSYLRLLGRSFGTDFAGGITAIVDGSDKVLLGATTSLRVLPVTRLGYAFTTADFSFMGGAAVPLRDGGSVKPAIAAGLGFGIAVVLGRNEGFIDAADSTVTGSLGPRIIVQKVLDGSRDAGVLALLQSGIDW